MSACNDPAAAWFVERGVTRWSPQWRTPITLLAVIGFCAVSAAIVYFIPWRWIRIRELDGESVRCKTRSPKIAPTSP